MVFRGHVRNGMVRLDEPAMLPEGAAVRIEVVENARETCPESNREEKPTSIEQELTAIWQDLPAHELASLPRDLTNNLDHYIYGVAKK